MLLTISTILWVLMMAAACLGFAWLLVGLGLPLVPAIGCGALIQCAVLYSGYTTMDQAIKDEEERP